MMRMLLPVLLLLIGVGGGVGAGFVLAPEGEALAPEEVSDEAAEDYENEPPAEDGEYGEEADSEYETGGEPPRVEQSGEGTEFVRLNNQFVVPIVRDGSVRSLVVMGLTIEVTTGLNSEVFDQEPRLRDSFLRVLFAHANAGGFDGVFTDATAMAPLREGLREAAQGVLGRGNAFDVLITDITRQDA